MKFRELFVPLAIVAMVIGMMLPMPPVLLDIFLITNLLMALALLLSALSVNDPIKLSALPTILLLATLYRLTLNISTTRLILSGSDAGQVVAAFGSVVIGGNLAVGVVVFLIITLIQFIVIAKGAERIAEVAARFTLDALPGKQMAVDADVRSGLIDVEKAREKREELQMESRFYGALDGAMKFVKGDAVAGLVIVVINVLGGIAVGLLVDHLSIAQSLQKFLTLTIGDGLACQIPALLNSLTAGIIVTKVARSENSSIINELFSQIGQGKMVKAMIGCVALLLGCLPGMPAVPFILVGMLLLLFGGNGEEPVPVKAPVPRFQPRVPALLTVSVPIALYDTLRSSAEFGHELDHFRQRAFERFGFLLPKVEIAPCEDGAHIQFRGTPVLRIPHEGALAGFQTRVAEALSSVLASHRTEFIDDTHTRRLLDFFETTAPELVASIIPGAVTVTQLTVILRSLVREQIGIRHFDLIIQAVAECGPRGANERQMLEEVRIALARVISAQFSTGPNTLRAITLDPLVDIAFTEAERGIRSVDSLVVGKLLAFLAGVEAEIPVIVGRGSRALLADCLRARGFERPVLAFEEVIRSVTVESACCFELAGDEVERVLETTEVYAH